MDSEISVPGDLEANSMGSVGICIHRSFPHTRFLPLIEFVF